MAADIVIRGGTVFDGSGAPGRAADVAIADGVIREIGPDLRGEPRARRVGLRGRARVHRHPHALRRAGVLGSGAAAVVVPRRHHRGRGQLRLHDRADPARAPRHDRAHARERRGHGPRDAGRGHRVGVRDVPRVPRRRSAGAAPSLNFTAYVGHSALRLYVMGDAAYERAATADEIERMCRARRARRSTRARPASRPASRTRTGASTASPCRAASPSATRSTRCSCAAGEAGKGVVLITPGEQCTYADVYEWQPRVGRPFTYPLFASPGGKHLDAGRDCTSRAWRRGASVWPQVTPRPLTMQFTLADPYSLNTGTVFGELMKVGRAVRLAAYRDPDVAGARGRRPRAVADEAALGDLRGLRVASASPSCRAGA